MKNDNISDKLSIIEAILLLFIFTCYIGALYFIIANNRAFLILFFVLHTCLSIVFILIIHDKMSGQIIEQKDHISSQFEEEKQLILKCNDEIAELKKERETLLVDKEKLSAKCADAEKRIEELTISLDEKNASLEKAPEVSNLNHLLPQNENPVNLNIIECANRVIDEMTPYSKKSGIQLLISSASDALTVRADASFMRILFRNIIDNSIKYMNRNGSLIITISNIADDLFIVLKDNGDGLPSVETSRIFELNYQGSNRISGNGLGLTQAKAIVEYYGGTIYAKSDAGKGMGIYIQLPTSSR
ncbi:MAG: hypothetical protein E7299_08785 [Lachnospiraceae bacterium]|nr:hypothetical protein [Lachnospiraceae bacterium]